MRLGHPLFEEWRIFYGYTISDTELCSLLSNALENALRALQQQGNQKSGGKDVVYGRKITKKPRTMDEIVEEENGVVVEEGPSKEFFANPREERTRTFLQNIEQHYE